MKKIIILIATLFYANFNITNELHEAVRNNDYNKVEDLIKNKNYDINSRDKIQQTPLHIAATSTTLDFILNKHSKIAKLLINEGANVNAKDINGDTPLHYAAQFNNAGMISLLIRNKANIDAKNNFGQTPLHIAAHYHQNKPAEVLVKNNAQLNSRDNCEQLPIHYAINRNFEIDIFFSILKNLDDLESNTERIDPKLVKLILGKGYLDLTSLVKNSQLTLLELANQHCKKFPNDESLKKVYNLIEKKVQFQSYITKLALNNKLGDAKYVIIEFLLGLNVEQQDNIDNTTKQLAQKYWDKIIEQEKSKQSTPFNQLQ